MSGSPGAHDPPCSCAPGDSLVIDGDGQMHSILPKLSVLFGIHRLYMSDAVSCFRQQKNCSGAFVYMGQAFALGQGWGKDEQHL